LLGSKNQAHGRAKGSASLKRLKNTAVVVACSDSVEGRGRHTYLHSRSNNIATGVTACPALPCRQIYNTTACNTAVHMYNALHYQYWLNQQASLSAIPPASWL